MQIYCCCNILFIYLFILFFLYLKGIKMESFPKCVFIPVDFYEVRHVKASFKKLMRACVPSSTPTADATFYKTVEESEWLLQVLLIFKCFKI